MKPVMTIASILAAGSVLGACATLQQGPVGNPAVPEPAQAVDLSRYAGLWYEIGRYENGFQQGCEGTTATYTVRDDGLVGVLNACRQDGLQGELRTIDGRARVVEGSGDAKLKVSFFGPFYFGDYWILDRAEDYSWSIVGEGSGRYLWLLSREPQPDDATRNRIMSRARALGYDLSLLRPTRQPPE